jgi:hypothetical protein
MDRNYDIVWILQSRGVGNLILGIYKSLEAATEAQKVFQRGDGTLESDCYPFTLKHTYLAPKSGAEVTPDIPVDNGYRMRR